MSKELYEYSVSKYFDGKIYDVETLDHPASTSEVILLWKISEARYWARRIRKIALTAFKRCDETHEKMMNARNERDALQAKLEVAMEALECYANPEGRFTSEHPLTNRLAHYALAEIDKIGNASPNDLK